MEPGLDVASGLLKRLSLGNLSRVVGADADDVGAQEDEDIGAHLERAENLFTSYLLFPGTYSLNICNIAFETSFKLAVEIGFY